MEKEQPPMDALLTERTRGFQQGIDGYMDLPGIVNNRIQGRVKLVWLFIQALGNTSYVLYKLYQLPSMQEEPDQLFGWCEHVVNWCEAIAVCMFIFRFASSLLALLLCKDMAFQAQDAVENLESAGSFSFMQYLPVPAKIFYWWNNWEILKREYVEKPAATCLHLKNSKPQFNPCKVEHWRYAQERIPSGLFVLAVPCILIGYFIVRFAIPVSGFIFALLAFPASVVKMSSLPPGFKLKDWGQDECIHFLGVLNQISKMWTPQSIELNGFVRHVDAAKGRGEYGEGGTELKRRIITSSYEASRDHNFPTLEALSFACTLDIGTVGKVLNKGFGHATPYKPIHDDR